MTHSLALTLLPTLKGRNMTDSGERRTYKGTKKQIMIGKVSQAKIADYLRDVYVNGKTRVSAYAENIDSSIYSLDPKSIQNKIDWVAKGRDDFEELKEMVISEEQERMLRRSSLMQQKAMELLVSTVEAAQRRVQDEEASPKDITAAAGVIKTLMPAFESIANVKNENTGISAADRRARARSVIN